MVLITNASMFHRPHVQRGLEILDANNGEIWAKLEAGTEEYFQLDRPNADSLSADSRQHHRRGPRAPLVIQSLFMRIHGEPPSPAELRRLLRPA